MAQDTTPNGTFPNQKTESQVFLRWVQAPTDIAFCPLEKAAEVPVSPCSLWGSRVQQLNWGGLKPCQCATFTRPDRDRGWAGETRSHWTDGADRASVKGKEISAHFGLKPEVTVLFLWPTLW